MPINFPDSPSVNDTHTVGNKTWTWDGTSWNVVTVASGDHGNLAGLSDDDHTQYLRVDGTRSADSLTISDDLTVDTDTLHVDSTNDRVGIGTSSPATPLHVSAFTSGNAEVRIEADTDNNNESDTPYLSFAADGGIIEGVIGLEDNELVIANNVDSGGGIDFRTGFTNIYTDAPTAISATTRRMFIDTNGYVSMPNQPNFCVGHDTGAIASNVASVITFNRIHVNQGNRWNSATNTFVAPVTGNYLFWWTGIAGTANDVYRICLYVNGANAGFSADIQNRIDTTETGSAYIQGTMIHMIPLSTNDQVTLRFVSDSGSSLYGASDYLRFGGWLHP